jgi:hypothetical protein
MYILFRKICYWAFCFIVVVPIAIILFILGGIDAILGAELHEDFSDFMSGILSKVDYDR